MLDAIAKDMDQNIGALHATNGMLDKDANATQGGIGSLLLLAQSGDSSELASRLPCKGKSVRNRGVSQIMPFLVILRSLLRGGFI